MKGRTAVVTGASRGIGRAVAAALASRGANVVINYAGNRQAAEETQALCAQAAAAGGYDAESLIVCADIADSDACSALIEAAVTKFGSVDILVNNAGITKDNLLMRMSESEFDDVIATNLRGTFLMMKAVSRQMMKQRYGRIINMASIVGVRGNSGQINYAASKAGVIGMTKSFAKEVAARGITVNAVAPGFIETDMTKVLQKAAADAIMSGIPMKRMGSAEEVAEAAAFFASEAASYVTGQVLCVDGGM